MVGEGQQLHNAMAKLCLLHTSKTDPTYCTIHLARAGGRRYLSKHFTLHCVSVCVLVLSSFKQMALAWLNKTKAEKKKMGGRKERQRKFLSTHVPPSPPTDWWVGAVRVSPLTQAPSSDWWAAGHWAKWPC